MKTSEIRKAFLDFFKSKEHAIFPSSSLIPANDPTLLFTTAGMVQFKPFFAWTVTPPHLRIATVQKSLRAGGKGSDLENVGRTSRHHTFFEMLGNFSFGDYFKKEAIRWAWEFVTEVIKLPKDRLWASIYQDDEESFGFWSKDVGLTQDRIVRLGKKDNFWGPAGDSGACGPCSEIYVDLGPKFATVGWDAAPCTNPNCRPGCDCDRYLEFWNLVFNQFFQEPDGTQKLLPKTGIDTGMGLERLAMIVQGVESVYYTDGFLPLLAGIWELKNPESPEPLPSKVPRPQQVALNVVADHVRALCFAVADGAVPSNEGRGYVLRRILRRAVRFAKHLGLDRPFMYLLAPRVVNQYGDAYPELKSRREHIVTTIKVEEENFHNTLRRGMELLLEFMDDLRATKATVLPGNRAFFLADTHGFPVDLTREMLEEKGFTLDDRQFEKHMEKQKDTSKKTSRFGTAGSPEHGLDLELVRKFAGPFVGYRHDPIQHVFETESRMSVLAEPEDEGEIRFALDPTPFYAESGGQTADQGKIVGQGFEIEVLDCRKAGDLSIHLGRVIKGREIVTKTASPLPVKAIVDRGHRMRSARHHTATHLLQASLRKTLGSHIHQAGSLVTPERFRFDFSHPQALGEDVLRAVEEDVNERILENRPVSIREMGFKEAIAAGALAFFGDKYGDRVRVVKIEGCSTELCGGTHVASTGEIGLFSITGESSVAAGTRRIEVVCGTEARAHLLRSVDELSEISRTLKVPAGLVARKIESLLEREKELSRRLKALQDKLTAGSTASAAPEIVKIDGVSLVCKDLGDVDMDGCRSGADRLLEGLGSGVVVVGSRIGEKACLVAKLSRDLAGKKLKAGDIVKRIAVFVGGSGGGRPDMAQAGGNEPGKLTEALGKVPEVVRSLLEPAS